MTSKLAGLVIGMMAIIATGLLPSAALAQETVDSAKAIPFFSVTGSATLTADYYSSTSTPDGAQKPRRPGTLHRLIIAPEFHFGDVVSIPLNIIITTPETNTLTPSVSNPTVTQFLENPANALAVTTKIGWAGISLGSHTPTYSALTVGDQQIFGAGIDLTPGQFRLAASYGTSQRAVEPDSARNIHGTFRRDMMMARVAYGKEDGGIVGVNVIRAKDDPRSLHNDIVAIVPAHPIDGGSDIIVPIDTLHLRTEEGLVASLDFRVPFTETASFAAEGAVSSFTADQSSAAQKIEGNPLAGILTTRLSTRLDVAGNAKFSLQQKTWGVTLSGLYMGAGFVPLGYAFAQPDRLELSIAPNVHMLNDGLVLGGSIGERINNLSGTKGETQTQLIGSANISAAISEALGVSAHYSNYGIRNNRTSDSLKIENVSQSLSIDPTLTLRSNGITNIISAALALDNYRDYNVISGAEGSNDSRSLLASYTALLDSLPLTVDLLVSYLENRMPTGTLTIRSAGVRLGYSFLERKLTTSLSATASGSTPGASATDHQLFYRLETRYRITSWVDLAASIGNNRFTYGNPIPQGETFGEILTQLSLTTRF